MGASAPAADRRWLSDQRPMMGLTDDELVARARAGETGAFEAIYDRYARRVLAFCIHMLGSREEAEDALQLTFVSVYRALGRGDTAIALRPWLYTIARNRCLSMLRSRRTAPVVDGSVADQLCPNDPQEQVQRLEELREVIDDMQRLPLDQRAALVLFELGDQSHSEIAAVLGVRPAKVKALIFQARKSLVRGRQARDSSCAEIRERLATVRGKLTARGRLRAHIDRCPGCAAFEAEVRRQQAACLLIPAVLAGELKRSVLRSSFGRHAGVAAGAGAGAGGGGVVVTGGMTAGGTAGGLGTAAGGLGTTGAVAAGASAVAPTAAGAGAGMAGLGASALSLGGAGGVGLAAAAPGAGLATGLVGAGTEIAMWGGLESPATIASKVVAAVAVAAGVLGPTQAAAPPAAPLPVVAASAPAASVSGGPGPVTVSLAATGGASAAAGQGSCTATGSSAPDPSGCAADVAAPAQAAPPPATAPSASAPAAAPAASATPPPPAPVGGTATPVSSAAPTPAPSASPGAVAPSSGASTTPGATPTAAATTTPSTSATPAGATTTAPAPTTAATTSSTAPAAAPASTATTPAPTGSSSSASPAPSSGTATPAATVAPATTTTTTAPTTTSAPPATTSTTAASATTSTG